MNDTPDVLQLADGLQSLTTSTVLIPRVHSKKMSHILSLHTYQIISEGNGSLEVFDIITYLSFSHIVQVTYKSFRFLSIVVKAFMHLHRGRRGCHRMVVGFTITYKISAYHHYIR